MSKSPTTPTKRHWVRSAEVADPKVKRITKRQAIAKFEKAVELLREICADGKDGDLDAYHLYLAGSDLHLMRGPSHDRNSIRGRPRHHAIVMSATLKHTDCGDW